MALNTEQISALRKSHFDEEVVDVIFPHLLSREDWVHAVNECKAAWGNRKKRPEIIEIGMAWANHGTLQTSRKRIQALIAHDMISIVMLFDGSHWTPDPLLRYLAHRQLGLLTPAPAQFGSVTGDLLIKEFKEKVFNSIRFAQCYEEASVLPDSFNGRRIEDISTTEEYAEWRKAYIEFNQIKHPRRHAYAESLRQECRNLLEHIENLEAKDGHFSAGHLCMLMGMAFEAGKLHAYLEREKDPAAIAENLQGARMMRNKSSPERRCMETAFYTLLKRGARPPNISELRSKLGVHKIKSKSSALPDNLRFEGLVISQKRFKNLFDQIKKSYKKKRA